MSWVDLIESFLADQADISEKTEDWYRARLRPFGEALTEWGVTSPAGIEVWHINRHLKRLLRAGLSWSTRNGTYTAVGRWFTWFQQRRLVETSPFLEPKKYGLTRPRKIRQIVEDIPLSYVRRMINAAEREANSSTGLSKVLALRDVALMRLLISTGIRRAEAVGLNVTDLALEIGEIRVIKGKGGHERRGILTAETVTALERWLEVRPETTCPAVFVSLHPNKRGARGQRLRPDAINDVMIKWRKRANLPDVSVSPHKWRHRFGTELGKARNLFVLQELMGHSDISTTRIYVQTDAETMKRLVQEFGPVVDL